jgi:hypothetical protein
MSRLGGRAAALDCMELAPCIVVCDAMCACERLYPVSCCTLLLLLRGMSSLQGEYGVMNLAKRIASRRHFLGSKLNQAEGVFEEGQQLYWEQRFSEEAERWGRVALLQHGPSLAHLSSMLFEGRAGVSRDFERAFDLVAAGAALGCAHSKGALGRCYVGGYGVTEDEAIGCQKGLRLEGRARRRAAALGSLWLERATTVVIAALRRTMPRLRDSTALQRRRGMHPLSTTWASCLRTVMVLRRTMRRLRVCTALHQRRGLQKLSLAWAAYLSTAMVLRRTVQRQSVCTASPPRRGMQAPPQH